MYKYFVTFTIEDTITVKVCAENVELAKKEAWEQVKKIDGVQQTPCRISD